MNLKSVRDMKSPTGKTGRKKPVMMTKANMQKAKDLLTCKQPSQASLGAIHNQGKAVVS